MKGYKAFDRDLKCRSIQFKVGQTYKIEGKLQICNNGFHFCQNFFDIYNYYSKDINTRVCEIEAVGEVSTEGDKSATSEIKIIKELSKDELLNMFMNNSNSGNRNSGNRNSGDWNSGNRNSGDWNSGYGNSGNRNSGNRNSGDWNSGDWNSGNRNSGYGNSGNRNSGDWNSGNGNSGYFNTTIPVYLFNKPSAMIYTQDFENKIRALNVKPIVTYVPESEMTSQEKLDHPSSKVTGGFLRKTDRMDWTRLTDKDKEFILSLPNYDDEVFKQISGISLLVTKTIKVQFEGQTIEIDMEKAKALGIIK